MKVRILGIQPGTVTDGMDNELYFQTQLAFAEKKYDGEEKTENEVRPRVHFGKSLVIDPLGNIVAALEDEPWASLSVEIDTENIRYARARLNWERDRHPELYGIVSDPHYGKEGMIYEQGF